MYCGSIPEMQNLLDGYTLKMEGRSGIKSERVGQLWTKPNGDWFVLQIIPDDKMSCAVVGGEKLVPFIAGDPA